MTSTSQTSRRTPTGSPLLTSIQLPVPSSYILDDLQTLSLEGKEKEKEKEKESLPSVSTAVKNLIVRHTQEIRESLETAPRVGISAKKAFREFYLKEGKTVFDFLDKPLKEHQTLSQATQILKRFGKGEYTGNKNKLKDLVLDVDCTNIETIVDPNWITQTRTILESWRVAMTEFTQAEKNLQEHMTAFEEIQKRVNTLLGLPQSDGYEALTSSMELYLKNIFQEHNIEEEYNNTIHALKKILILTDSMFAIRQMVNYSNEPLCSVCFQDPVSLVSIPCGHTFCGQCGGRQITNCYICRVQVKDRIKIYFS
jgi:hypothetical protein